MTRQENATLPAAYAANLENPAPVHARVRNALRRWVGFDLSPSDKVVRQYGAGLWITDPVAESFVEEVYYGDIGSERGRELLDRALNKGIDAVDGAPESMRALFAEFDTLPPWADPQLIESGAAAWRRWGYDMGSIANAGTMDTYTEGWLAGNSTLARGWLRGPRRDVPPPRNEPVVARVCAARRRPGPILGGPADHHEDPRQARLGTPWGP
ncbi:hypothetical protein HNP40_001598 [Mycobacteroides chelonae]|nr:hypothetical protein [Mycobacteroides chelonae]